VVDLQLCDVPATLHRKGVVQIARIDSLDRLRLTVRLVVGGSLV